MNPLLPPRIIITPGEPAGIGPDITVEMAQKEWHAQLVVVADPDLLSARAKLKNLTLQLIECDLSHSPTLHQPGTLQIVPIQLNEKAVPGTLNLANASYVIQTLEKAAQLCQKKIAQAIVTGPVNKKMLNQADIFFSGHTEFFANYCGVEQTVMLFVIDKLKVALATTHLPLVNVPGAITKTHLRTILTLLNKGLQDQFKIHHPCILVCGLNPHAGEGGYLGREEIDIISPVLTEFEDETCTLKGPLPADTIFTPPFLQKADAILAMYHDQALPIVKYVGFHHAVNVTLGLPFVRTSVDHGTAIDIAGTEAVNAGSMEAAIQLAITLTK